jgi:hypothetical protein
MTELVGLGPGDARSRWIGIRRHQAVLVVVGLGLCGTWILSRRAPVVELAAGVLLLGGAVPARDGLTAYEVVATMTRYATRTHWSSLVIREVDGDVVLFAPCDATFRAYELEHRGRLDLSGRDVTIAESLAVAVDALSAGSEHSHLSQHVLRRADTTRTMLALPSWAHPSESWRSANNLAADCTLLEGGSGEVLERMTYLRVGDALARVYRVKDFSSASASGSLLEHIARTPIDFDLSVQLEVVAREQSHRLSARAVHQMRSDEVTASAAGFRRSARSTRIYERLAQREVLVAEGRALVRLAVFVVVSAPSLEVLERDSATLWRRAHDAGLRLERGAGSQIEWFRAQLPGTTTSGARWWTHWATSADLVSLRLPAHDAGSGLGGDALGVSQYGSNFAFDVFDAYGAGLLTNPNVVVAGAIGAGKSTLVKMQIARALARGRRAVVVDPKGEYEELAARHGTRSIALGRDGWCSPFADDEVEGRHLLRALLASAQARALNDEQHYALDEAWNRLGSIPTRVLYELYRILETHLRAEASPQRSLALILHRFIHGDLAGLFDGDGAPLRLGGELAVVDLSAQWSSQSLSVATLSVVAAAQQMVGDESALGYLVIDEAWALMSDSASMRWLHGSWKLARAKGLSHVVVLHRWSDVTRAGNAGSVERDLARGLLRECETAWLFRQPPDEAREMALSLDLHDREVQYLTALPQGAALVRYGAHRSIVRVEPRVSDRRFIDTDAAMRAS